jgi:glycogen operon protein
MQSEDWGNGAADTLIAALYAKGGRALVVFHRGAAPLTVTPPSAREGHEWRLAFDAANVSPNEDVGETVVASARSVLLLVEEKSSRRRAPLDADDALVATLAEAAGVSTLWHDVDGAAHRVPRDTLVALLGDLRLPARSLCEARDSLARLSATRDRRALPEHLVARDSEAAQLRLGAKAGATPARLVVTHENGREEIVALTDLAPDAWRGVDGRTHRGYRAQLPLLPSGRYRLRAEDDAAVCHLIVAPARCHLPDETRRIGLSAQLYALRRDGDQGIGDFTTLARLAQNSARAGASLLAINPLHALFPQDRSRASPYYPSDRRFLDWSYVDLRDLMGASADEGEAQALSALDIVDYPAVHALKQRALGSAFARFDAIARERPDAAPVVDFDRFVADGGEALLRFAIFEAIGETQGGARWRDWPAELRDARPEALAAFAAENAPRLRYHQFLQWVADRQFAQAAQTARADGLALGFCRDLAVGAAPDGAESWSKASRLLPNFSIGAPPDPFSRDGQNWGLPAPDPLMMTADGGADFAELARANMRHAGALRIDHVMGLARLFVVPQGEKACAGAYVSYPLDALLAQLSLESHRARCIVVGEDLGTLPWGFRERLEAANVLSYRVVWFERAGAGFIPPHHYPSKAMACVSTHDLPTLEGWWRGADIAEKEALGLLAPVAAMAERDARADDKRALLWALRDEGLIDNAHEDAAFDDRLAFALHAFAARAPSLLAMAQLDDLAGDSVAVNLPGTDRERPNWRRKLAPCVDALFETPRAAAILAGLRRNVV